MKRRAFALAVAGVLGGCASTGADSSSPRATDTRTPTETATPTPTRTPTETETETPTETRTEQKSWSDRHNLQDTYLSEELFEFEVRSWTCSQEIRVYDPEKDGLRSVEPTNRFFFQYEILIHNQSNKDKTPPSGWDFGLLAYNIENEPIKELPGGFSFSQMREQGVEYPIDKPIIMEFNSIGPGLTKFYKPIFDVGICDVGYMGAIIENAVQAKSPPLLAFDEPSD